MVTASQILGTAALADGLRVRGFDQTGLAQKGGPVVSDLIMGTDPAERGNKLGDGECDLYLGCDLVVAANPDLPGRGRSRSDGVDRLHRPGAHR